MIKIEPYNSHSLALKSNPPKEEKQPLSTNQIVGYTLAGAAVMSGIVYGIVYHNKQAASKTEQAALNFIKEVFEKQMSEFPKDIDYRKQLLKALGMSEAELYKLRPVAGPEEYAAIVKEFSDNAIHYTPGKTLITDIKDGYNLEGVQAKTFRASMHMHTVHSDGKLTVKELLDKSAAYADEVFEANKNNPNAKAKHAPFTIAITDHDTLESCKEAIKIIYDNPEKYKNLRVVLGAEMTVENRMLGSELKSPVPIHMTTHGLNPYDTELNRLFNDKKQKRTELMKELIKKCSQAEPELKEKFSFAEAEKLYPSLKNKVTHINYSMKDYFQYKIIFSECFEKNSALQNELKNAGVNIDEITYNSFFEKYSDKIKRNYPEYYYKYYGALKNYISDVLKITPEEAEKKLMLTDSTKQRLKTVQDICMNELPKMELQPAFLDMEEAINLIKNQPYGYMTWAHPGCTGIGDCLKGSDSFKGMETIFRKFKEKGGDRALAAEIHYPYFGGLGKSNDWLNAIRYYAKSNNLYYSGGLDCHGKNIFYGNK